MTSKEQALQLLYQWRSAEATAEGYAILAKSVSSMVYTAEVTRREADDLLNSILKQMGVVPRCDS